MGGLLRRTVTDAVVTCAAPRVAGWKTERPGVVSSSPRTVRGGREKWTVLYYRRGVTKVWWD